MDALTHVLLLIASGFGVGLLVGLTGVGGGSLMTPLLVYAFGVKMAVAVGTDLLFAALTKASGAVSHARIGNVDWRVTGWLAAGSVPSAIATLVALKILNPSTAALNGVLRPALGVALLLTVVAILVRPLLLARNSGAKTAPHARKNSETRAALVAETAPANELSPWATIAVGAALGVLVTLSSVGAGALGVTVLMLLYPALPLRKIIGSDIAHAVPLTLVAGAGHAWMGNVDYMLLGALLIGSIPGITLGTRLSGALPQSLVRSALAGTLTFAGFKFLSVI